MFMCGLGWVAVGVGSMLMCVGYVGVCTTDIAIQGVESSYTHMYELLWVFLFKFHLLRSTLNCRNYNSLKPHFVGYVSVIIHNSSNFVC